MTITLENTSRLTELNGVPARIWEGTTSTGIKVIAFITRIAISNEEPPEAQVMFREELQECKAPSAEATSFPLRMIL